MSAGSSHAGRGPTPGPPLGEDARLRSLASMARALGRSARVREPARPEVEELARAAAEELLVVLGAASASVSRLEPGTGVVRTMVNVGLLGPTEEPWPADEVYRLADFPGLTSMATDLVVWRGSLTDPELNQQDRQYLHELGKGSSMAAPMVVDGALWGELFATRLVGDPPFSELDVAYIEALSAILSGAVSRAEHVAGLERLAYQDPLTGLANRRALEDATARALGALATLSVGQVALAYLDVNGLKAVNDAHGHPAGDRVLRSVAALLRSGFGDLHGCLPARIGGDEFAVLVTGHDLERVLAAARATCRAARQLPFGVGLACGVAAALGDGTTPPGMTELLRAADRAQYRAKRLGGSGVVLGRPDGTA